MSYKIIVLVLLLSCVWVTICYMLPLYNHESENNKEKKKDWYKKKGKLKLNTIRAYLLILTYLQF